MENTTDQARTEGYAAGIAATVAALEELVTYGEVPDDERDEISTEARELLDDLTGSSLDAEGGDYVTAWIDTSLAVTVHEARQLGCTERDVASVEVLVTVGGPGATVTANVDDYARLRVDVIWGSSRASRHVFAPEVASRLLDLADCY